MILTAAPRPAQILPKERIRMTPHRQALSVPPHRLSCHGRPLWQMHCHCESCRSARPSGCTLILAIADGAWHGTAEEPALLRSSPGVERRFCGTRGTRMACRSAAAPAGMHFCAATLHDPARYRPRSHGPRPRRRVPALGGSVRWAGADMTRPSSPGAAQQSPPDMHESP